MPRFFRLVAAAFMALAIAGPAVAQSSIEIVRDAKERCLIGERLDGYLGEVTGATVTREIRAAMDEINVRRRARYDELAREQGTTIEVVARLAGESVIERTPANQCVLGESGTWERR